MTSLQYVTMACSQMSRIAFHIEKIKKCIYSLLSSCLTLDHHRILLPQFHTMQFFQFTWLVDCCHFKCDMAVVGLIDMGAVASMLVNVW